jgi:hypothetical protein
VNLLLLGFPVLNFVSREAILNPRTEEKNLTQSTLRPVSPFSYVGQGRKDAKVRTRSRIPAKRLNERKTKRAEPSNQGRRPLCCPGLTTRFPAKSAISGFLCSLRFFAAIPDFCLNLGVFAPLREI